MAMFNGPGPGRKQCPSCKAYIGVRTAVCPCGHAFEKKARPAPVATVTPPAAKADKAVEKTVESQPVAVAGMGRRVRVFAAPGDCPVSYDGDVKKWAQKIQSMGAENSVEYTATALRIWLGQFVKDSDQVDSLIQSLNLPQED